MIVAAVCASLSFTYCAASRVVRCSNTIFSAGKSLRSGTQHAIDEEGFAIEQVDVGIGDFAMHQQRKTVRCIASSVG